MLAASIAPSAPPAPRTVCSSSTNSTIAPVGARDLLQARPSCAARTGRGTGCRRACRPGRAPRRGRRAGSHVVLRAGLCCSCARLRPLRPERGGPPPGVTEVRFLQDDRALYVGIRVRARTPRSGHGSPRARTSTATTRSGCTSTRFTTAFGLRLLPEPLGIQQDTRENGDNWNPNWDTTLRSAGRVDDDRRGYTMESRSRGGRKYQGRDDDQTWGVILTRKSPARARSTRSRSRGTTRRCSRRRPPHRGAAAPGGSGLELIPPSPRAAWGRDETPTSSIWPRGPRRSVPRSTPGTG